MLCRLARYLLAERGDQTPSLGLDLGKTPIESGPFTDQPLKAFAPKRKAVGLAGAFGRNDLGIAIEGGRGSGNKAACFFRVRGKSAQRLTKTDDKLTSALAGMNGKTGPERDGMPDSGSTRGQKARDRGKA